MYDVIIVGTGSAGLPAGMYASRYKLQNLVIGEIPGGALASSHCVENFPGIISASGADIMKNFHEHALHSGSTIVEDRVETVAKIGEGKFVLTTQKGEEYQAKRVILTMGNSYKTLNVPGEKEFHGQGVSYCATCDGNFYKNLIVAMVGAGNSAITEAIYLASITKEVHILIRSDVIKAETIWIEKAKQIPNIIFHYFTEITEIFGDTMGVKGVHLSTKETLNLDGVFVAIGSSPVTIPIDHLDLQKDADGCLVVDKRQETNIPGLYAAGDITTNSNKFCQTIMSAAEGCLAAHSVHEDLL